MFDQLKQLQKIKELQDSVKKEKIQTENRGVKLIMNGSFMVESVSLNPELDIHDQEKAIQECFNDAIKKVQMAIATQFFKMM